MIAQSAGDAEYTDCISAEGLDFPNKCSILTFIPDKHAIPKTRKLHILLAWASLADNMGQG